MRTYCLVLLLYTFYTAQGQTYTVDDVPNTKLVNNSYVSNPDKLMPL